MGQPVDPGSDFKVWTNGLEPVTVTNTDPDTGATVVDQHGNPQVAVGILALRRIIKGDEAPVGDGGGVGYSEVDWTFVIADVPFMPVSRRDTITDSFGVVWMVGDVTEEAFGTLYMARGCTRVRS